MSLADDVLHALPEFRLHAESMMVDRANIVRLGVPVFDPNTGLIAYPDQATIYTALPVWLRMPTAMENERLFGEEQVTTSRFIACFRWDTYGVQIADVVRITESDDDDALTRDYRVLAIPTRSFVHFKGFGCETVE